MSGLQSMKLPIQQQPKIAGKKKQSQQIQWRTKVVENKKSHTQFDESMVFVRILAFVENCPRLDQTDHHQQSILGADSMMPCGFVKALLRWKRNTPPTRIAFVRIVAMNNSRPIRYDTFREKCVNLHAGWCEGRKEMP